MKKNIRWIGNLLLVTAPLVTLSLSLLSCSENQNKESITISKSILTETKLFSIPFTLSNSNWKQANIHMSTTTDGIELVDEWCQIENQQGNVNIKISNAISSSTSFPINLSITCYSDVPSQEESHTFNLSNIYILYSYSPSPILKDEVYLLNSSITNINLHTFIYRAYFNKSPDIEHKKAQLSLTPVHQPFDNSICLEQNESEIKYDEEKSKFYIDIFVHVKFAVSITSVILFDLSIQFWNSYQEYQQTTFESISAVFVKDETKKEIPDDFFDIQEIDGENVLLGLKSEITSASSPSEIGFYNDIVIPAGVTKVAADAFKFGTDVNNWFKNIMSLSINEELLYVEQNAFASLPRLFEIDISKYRITTEEEIPQWIKDDTIPIFGELRHQHGYIWTKSGLSLGEKIRQLLQSKGLATKWREFDPVLVTPKEIFEIDKSDNKVIGINPSYFDKLSKYKIIRLPEGVRKINDGALQILSEYPYQNDIGGNETRRIIFPRSIEEVGWMQKIGVAGPIAFNSQIGEIKNNCFQQMSLYNPSVYSPDSIISEPIYIDFQDAYSLTKIGSNSFAGLGIEGKMSIAANIEEVGDNAFYDNKLTELEFVGPIKKIGNNAFACTFPTVSLQTINLLSYGEINLNPDDPQEGQPNWIFQSEKVFDKICQENSGVIHINLSKLEEEKVKQVKDWLFDKQKIPNTWSIQNQ